MLQIRPIYLWKGCGGRYGPQTFGGHHKEIIISGSSLVAVNVVAASAMVTVRYRPGCQQVIADTLSCIPVEVTSGGEELSNQKVFQLEREKLVGREPPLEIRKYWNFRAVLTVQDGIIYKGDQIAVPMTLRSSFLERLHASHLGYKSTWRRAREVVYWPIHV